MDIRIHKVIKRLKDNIPSQFFGFNQSLRIGKLISKFRLNGKINFLKYSNGTTEIWVKSQVDEGSFAEDAAKNPFPKNCLYPTAVNKGISSNKIHFKLLDIGDYVGVEGDIFTTKTGEISVNVNILTILAKSIRPLFESSTSKNI